ncbi:aminoacyl-tRNA hydrolase [Legionella nagasakiensis]|uniref:aminoacyl-tRNA hydrolase n=1 Tax=Legionella nagasakiensis TaxID=535290 RepID=UPI00105594C4|nr:aminoacyl-tRNA hydrolase [Legionella nagasakiensis]
MTIKLIVGLKNPGASYASTRHNAGGWFVERLAQYYKLTFKAEKKLHGELSGLEFNGSSCKLLLPLTYMNHSGLSVRAVSQFYRIHASEILVAHDELDLPAGRIKLKTGGGHGGHNGLKDIINQLGCFDFHRLRVGIGHPGHKELVLNYVLGKPAQAERQLILDAIERGVDVMPEIIAGDLAKAMNVLNG